MGLLRGIIGSPINASVGGLVWLARQVSEAVDRETLDPGRVEAGLLALERQLEIGEIDEINFEMREAALLDELTEIRAILADRAVAATSAG